MPSKPEKLNAPELAAHEATRDVGAEILQSIKDMKASEVLALKVPNARTRAAMEEARAMVKARSFRR